MAAKESGRTAKPLSISVSPKLFEEIKLLRNGFRKTCATYSVAEAGELETVAYSMGTSITMLNENYKGLASKKQGEEYFSIMPPD